MIFLDDFIELLEEDCIELSSVNHIYVYPSLLIATAYEDCKDLDIKEIKESKCIYNKFKGKTYKSYKECMIDYVNYFIPEKYYNTTFIRTDVLLNYLYDEVPESILNNIDNIRSIIDIDEDAVSYLSDDTTKVFLPNTDPIIDVYKVKRISDNRQMLKTLDLEEAKKLADKFDNYCVYNSKGEKVYGKEKAKVIAKVEPINTTKNIEKSSIIILKNANLYENYNSTAPMRSISGTYKIVSSKKLNNRFEIAKTEDSPFNLGWINEKDIK